MKSMVMVAVVAMGLAGAGGAGAGTLPGMQAWAGQAGTNGVERHLTSCGFTNPVERAEMAAAWEENVLVKFALRERAYGLIAFVMARDKLAPASLDRVKSAVLAETVPPTDVIEVVTRLPLAEREPFRAVLEAASAIRFAKQPEYRRLLVKYTYLLGKSITGPEVSEADLVSYLLAPEGMPLGAAEICKKSIKERAVVLSRVKLRAEGKSFVVKDGVNPLVVMVQPVVTALNVKECAGLEAALRGLGATVQDVERKPLRDLVVEWQPKIMSGEMGTGDVNQALGKIAVALGPEEYNRFVDGYNNGTAGAK